VAIILAILAQADYIMDDTNSTIIYAGNWTRNLNSNVDQAQLFDGTAIATSCYNSEIGCGYATIPFVDLE